MAKARVNAIKNWACLGLFDKFWCNKKRLFTKLNFVTTKQIKLNLLKRKNKRFFTKFNLTKFIKLFYKKNPLHKIPFHKSKMFIFFFFLSHYDLKCVICKQNKFTEKKFSRKGWVILINSLINCIWSLFINFYFLQKYNTFHKKETFFPQNRGPNKKLCINLSKDRNAKERTLSKGTNHYQRYSFCITALKLY